MTYSEKLQHPEWQRKRLEIMQRDNFKCVYCNTSDQKLNVHHRYYISGREPWSYPDWSFVTVCDSCHKGYHEYAQNAFSVWEDFMEHLTNKQYSENFVQFMNQVIEFKSQNEKNEAVSEFNKKSR